MNIPQTARNADIVRRRDAGEKYPSIAADYGITEQNARRIYERQKLKAEAQAVRAKAKQPAREVTAYGGPVTICHGTFLRPAYVPPVALRQNGMRAAAAQAPMISMASSAHGSEGVA